MNRSEAIQWLRDNPGRKLWARDVNHASPSARPVGEEFDCWLDDGELVHSHPTDPLGNPVTSRFDHYYLRELAG